MLLAWRQLINIFSPRDVLCGQLQCEADDSRKKPVVDYGRARDKKIILPSGKKCKLVLLYFCSSEKKRSQLIKCLS